MGQNPVIAKTVSYGEIVQFGKGIIIKLAVNHLLGGCLNVVEKHIQRVIVGVDDGVGAV